MFPFTFGDKPLEFGQSSTVTCSVVQGDRPLELSWWFDGIQISEDRTDISMISGKKSTMLTIDSLSGEHSGNYTCMARNFAGTAEYTAQLFVTGSFRMLVLLFCIRLSFPSLEGYNSPYRYSVYS